MSMERSAEFDALTEHLVNRIPTGEDAAFADEVAEEMDAGRASVQRALSLMSHGRGHDAVRASRLPAAPAATDKGIAA